jgi:hypothetical protein
MAEMSLGAGVLALWLLLHTYQGVVHDAQLYTIQALSHLYPDRYANDLFLHYGSQDRYTLFSPLYAALIRILGIENAAAVMTFVSNVVLLAAAALLARSILPRSMVLLGLGFLVSLPADYGPGRIFTYAEMFITPRLMAEGLALAALAALIGRRHGIMVVLLAGASALHPLMAAPAIAVALYMLVGVPRPRLFAALAAASLLLIALVGLLLPQTSSLRIDAEWIVEVLDHEPYVFLTRWAPTDWSAVAVSLVSLYAGRELLAASPARDLCTAVLVVSGIALLAGFLGADVFKFAFVAQAQPYRCLWLAGALAALLLPAIAERAWLHTGPAGRATICLVAALWLLRNEMYALTLSPLVVLAATVAARGFGSASAHRYLYLGSLLALVLALTTTIANTFFTGGMQSVDMPAPALVDWIQFVAHDGLIPVVLIGAVWWACRAFPRRGAPVALTMTLLGALAAVPVSYSAWTHKIITADLYRAFAPWRQSIPEGSMVLWFEAPFMSWVLLERPSYFSVQQTGSALFSRAAGLEIGRRKRQLRSYLRYADFVREPGKPVPQETLASLCNEVDAPFIVSRADLQADPLARAPPGASVAFRAVRLYSCPRHS